MKCRKCGHKAMYNMRQHRLALCRQHYLDWIPEQTSRFIKKYGMFQKEDRVLVAVSGGKDSLALWDILMRLEYQADGLYIDLGIDGGFGYSRESRRRSQEFADIHGLRLHIISVAEGYGENITEMSARSRRGREKPCRVCGMTKRHIMNRLAREKGYDVLVTGHNLDDEAATLFSNTLNWQSGYLVRQSPVLEASEGGLVRKAKPLCRFYERDMAAYVFMRGINYVYEECPHAAGAKSIYYKELLNQMEEKHPSTKLVFYTAFLQAKEEGLFAPQADRDAARLQTCPTCGQPTTVPGECAFCRMVIQTPSTDGL